MTPAFRFLHQGHNQPLRQRKMPDGKRLGEHLLDHLFVETRRRQWAGGGTRGTWETAHSGAQRRQKTLGGLVDALRDGHLGGQRALCKGKKIEYNIWIQSTVAWHHIKQWFWTKAVEWYFGECFKTSGKHIVLFKVICATMSIRTTRCTSHHHHTTCKKHAVISVGGAFQFLVAVYLSFEG